MVDYIFLNAFHIGVGHTIHYPGNMRHHCHRRIPQVLSTEKMAAYFVDRHRYVLLGSSLHNRGIKLKTQALYGLLIDIYMSLLGTASEFEHETIFKTIPTILNHRGSRKI